MSRTDRDDDRWFWKNHFRYDRSTWEREHQGRWSDSVCWCENLPDAHMWLNPYDERYGVPSWWRKECRQQERAYSRNLLNKARNGHIDWDDLAINYRRPWFW